jgi:hypothetical protein
MKGFQSALIAVSCSACTGYTLTSVRPTFTQDATTLEVSCAQFPSNDETELNSRLAQLYENGWRIAATGHQSGFGPMAGLFLCLERPAGTPDVTRKPRARLRPPPPEAAPEDAAPEEQPPPKAKPSASKKKKPAPAEAAPAEPAPAPADDTDEAPRPRTRRPVGDDNGG